MECQIAKQQLDDQLLGRTLPPARAYETRCTKEAKNKMAAKGKMGAWWWWEENRKTSVVGMQQNSGLALGKGEDIYGEHSIEEVVNVLKVFDTL